MENIEAIDSLRASKTLNSPFNSKIPNVEEDADNYNIIINFGLFVSFIKQFYAAQTMAQVMLSLLTDGILT